LQKFIKNCIHKAIKFVDNEVLFSGDRMEGNEKN